MKKLPLVGTMTLALAIAGIAHSATFDIKQPYRLGGVSLSAPTLPAPPVPSKADDHGVQIIATTPIRSILYVDGEKIEVSGRSAVHLSASEEQIAQGIVEVRGLNLAFTQVPQAPLSNGIKTIPETGALGFALSDQGFPQFLKYDARTGELVGDLEGRVDAAFMTVLGRVEGDDKHDEDLYETPTQTASLNLVLQLNDAIEVLQKQAKDSKEVQQSKASMRFEMDINADQDFALPSYRLDTPVYELVIDYSPRIWFEVAKRLCIQPVRIGRLNATAYPFALNPEYTGDGLNFGLPEAKKQWSKADVVFNVKGWKTLWKPGYWQVDTAGSITSTEEANLLDEINDDHCVEVYFIDDFDPESAHGGGATWGSGTAGTKIISSDGNAHGGIDETHLAHELGHSMGLLHPSSAPRTSAEPGSTGTLMCPSGWLNDNPQANSQENKDKLSNPLFTFTFKVISAGPDCTDNADCGACY